MVIEDFDQRCLKYGLLTYTFEPPSPPQQEFRPTAFVCNNGRMSKYTDYVKNDNSCRVLQITTFILLRVIWP